MTAKVVKIEKENTNYHFTLEVPFGDELAIDQSMAHDGCCLTVVKVDKDKKQYVVTAMDETLLKTNLGTCQEGPLHHGAQGQYQHQWREPDGGGQRTRHVQRGHHPLYL